MRRFLVSLLLILCLIVNGANILHIVQNAHSSGHIILQLIRNGNNNTNSKVIILSFDDTSKGQFALARPILDKYAFKGSFFTFCNYVGMDDKHMTWQDIKTLQKEGHDIESHTMTHTNLDTKSQKNLIYEIGGSKQCLFDHGINATVFSYPASTGHSNATVVNVVSKYYNLARTADAPLAFLHCDGYRKEKDCRPFNDKGKPTYENRYDIREWGHHPHIQGQIQSQPSTNATNVVSFNQSQMFNQFVQEVNSQQNYNKNGCINAIPIVVYHKILPST
jgi:hypothetical protein